MVRAEAYAFGGLHERALPLFHQAIRLDPANSEAYWMLMGTSWALDSKEAVRAGDDFLRLFGDDHEVHNYLAFAHQLLGNYDRALEHYEAAITGSSSGEPSLDPLLFGGILSDELGDRGRAEELWRWGVELVEPKLEAYPDNYRMRLILTCFYGLLGEDAAFFAQEQRALETADFHAFALNYLVAVHARRGETERAIELLTSSVRPGQTIWGWDAFLRLAFAPPLESEAFGEILEANDAEMRRLGELY